MTFLVYVKLGLAALKETSSSSIRHLWDMHQLCCPHFSSTQLLNSTANAWDQNIKIKNLNAILYFLIHFQMTPVVQTSQQMSPIPTFPVRLYGINLYSGSNSQLSVLKIFKVREQWQGLFHSQTTALYQCSSYSLSHLTPSKSYQCNISRCRSCTHMKTGLFSWTATV